MDAGFWLAELPAEWPGSRVRKCWESRRLGIVVMRSGEVAAGQFCQSEYPPTGLAPTQGQTFCSGKPVEELSGVDTSARGGVGS